MKNANDADTQMKVRTKNAEIKKAAKKSLTGHWGLAILSMLAVVGVMIALPIAGWFLFSLIRLSGVGIVLGAIAAFAWCLISVAGLAHIYLNLCRDKGDETSVRDIFYGFSIRPLRFFGYYLRLYLYILAGMLVYIVGIVIVSLLASLVDFFIYLYIPLVIAWMIFVFALYLSYSQVVYLLVDDPDMKTRDAFQKSAQLMRENKMKYLGLNLSFFLWYLLGTITIGIVYLYVAPYVSCTSAQFYLELRKLNGMEKPEIQELQPDFEAQPQIPEQEPAE